MTQMRKRADTNKRGRVPRPLVLSKILRKKTKRTEPSASYETSESKLESAWTSEHRRPEAKVTRNTAYMAKSAREAETKGSQRVVRKAERRTLKGRERGTEKKTEKPKGWLCRLQKKRKGRP